MLSHFSYHALSFFLASELAHWRALLSRSRDFLLSQSLIFSIAESDFVARRESNPPAARQKKKNFERIPPPYTLPYSPGVRPAFLPYHRLYTHTPAGVN